MIPARPKRRAGPGAAVVAYDLLLVLLGIIGATVSGWSIATLLHDDGGMPWKFACMGVGVYDLLAFMAGLMVYIRRDEPHRAVGAQVLMMAAVAGSAYVNYRHGAQLGGPLVALLLGAAPVTFEIGFAMRHNVLSLVTAILFPRAMWRRYRDGVWIKLYTGSLPEAGGSLPEAGGSLPEAGGSLPEAGGSLPEDQRKVPEALPEGAGDLPEALPEAPLTLVKGVQRSAEALEGLRRSAAESMSAHLGVPADVLAPPRSSAPSGSPAEALPEASGDLPEGAEARSEAVAEALRKGERITGETVASLYGVSDRTGRTYIRRAKEINAALSGER